MSPWSGQQQKDPAVPQLSCVMCRDRKLKCDKLDPCTNCKSSGAVCAPIHRPRLPRGRHARRHRPKTTTPPPSASSHSDPPPPPSQGKDQQGGRSRAQSGSAPDATGPITPPNTEADADAAAATAIAVDDHLGTRIAALDAEISVLKELVSAREPQSLLHYTSFPRQPEKLLQKGGGSNEEEPASDLAVMRPPANAPCAEAQMAVEPTDDLQVQSLFHPPSPDILEAPAVSSSPGSWSLGLSSDFWADMMDYQTHDRSPATHGLQTYAMIHDELVDTAVSSSGGVGCVGGGKALRLLGPDALLLNDPSPVSPTRDPGTTRKLFEIYLQNVDPIIKILHRPTLKRWMTSGPPVGSRGAAALECAICYAAATTMTEAQSQAKFQKSKSEVSTMHRRMCNDAIEMAGLLTTRDMTVLQAFVLYLVGRRSEDKGTAVWALVALAVRLTSALKLNNPPSGPESFFQQQMRLRLWLTVCLMDLQAALAESSEPLISYRDAAFAVSSVRNINDADFDESTVHLVDSSEELTDTTLALVTYRVQVIGRLLNFPSSETGVSGAPPPPWSSEDSSSSSMMPASARPFDPEGRRQMVRQFKEEVFGLLHYCDPESSAYAWFTWHSAHCIVAAIRLSELLPFRFAPAAGHRPPLLQTPTQNVNEVLYRALQNLEKAQIIHSDPRSDSFRWYITAPRLALSTAIAECSTCADAGVVRWAWPIIESFFRQYEDSVSLCRCPLSQVPLLRLVREARERLAPMLQHDGG